MKSLIYSNTLLLTSVGYLHAIGYSRIYMRFDLLLLMDKEV